ncbi:uncharacterized protein LOC133926310 [Phragmites australis]|uniref:uncharacterized protein LOC133926310 n=1 Tax=Phragmites australis TaxID=29695 RepID=UPI002D766B00|nr:uncharacterized protein LOC133926310 [Phragmites australis]XP_062228160.1 uncharacterized protein LOC133926310 [Phragmites australis]XP_062228161.1 uncharacterized protein LOC133926310 [Phragmites australis]
MPLAISFLHLPPNAALLHPFTLRRTHHLSLRSDPPPRRAAVAAAAEAENPLATADVEMVRGRDGVWTARSPKVVVLWDLDNKPPRGPPFPAASSLIAAASLLGRVVSVSAFANRHAFSHIPARVFADRRDRRALDRAERAGIAAPPVPYSCAVCGRRFPTRPDLTRHFRQLHERERNKKLARLRSLKGKKRHKFRERFISGNTKYEDAARELLTPKVGYGLASELRRAGVHVRTVPDKPQAADHALKRQVKHSVACGVDWVVLVSDDSDFTDTVRKARDADLKTVVIGDGCRALGKVADIWLPWDRVENGEVDEEMLRGCKLPEFGDEQGDECDEEFIVEWDTSDLDDVVDGIVGARTSLLGAVTMSAFADEDITDGIFGVGLNRDDMFWSSDDEDEDGYL